MWETVRHPAAIYKSYIPTLILGTYGNRNIQELCNPEQLTLGGLADVMLQIKLLWASMVKKADLKLKKNNPGTLNYTQELLVKSAFVGKHRLKSGGN